ncbi:hypothetical protein GE300_00730 [Rhodobacteraceae bacterium 2CG4]|uniref:DUF2029 domain-containing protein n=1 Tax=Halovulum marinum TaxID=2662447 RepID=A0A6L5YV52_9RHOB|nr:hypothetical protein [Halovulum marinum]MSU88137.1 hypothetical protein [Halovulum marinum]
MPDDRPQPTARPGARPARRGAAHRMLRALPFLAFVLWWALLALALKAVTLDAGDLPVDYRTYAEAAERARQTGSPYRQVAAAQAVWADIHAAARARFDGGGAAVAPISGPYLYPPSLALWLPPGPATGLVYLALHTLAAAGLCLGWLRLAGARSGWWLLPAALSADLLAVYAGGNVEILLLAASLAACGLLWRGPAVLAGVPVALVLLVKPQFALLFAAFAAFVLLARGRAAAGGLAAAAAVALVLAGLEVLRWPTPARAGALAYLSEPAARQYFALPPASWWPMDHWNRAPLQALLSAGLPRGAAMAATLAGFAARLATSLLALRRHPPGFALAFALSYVLLLIGRPIDWALPLLGLLTLGAAAPGLGRGARRAGAAAALALGLAHWAAFIGFATGRWPGLLSLQTPAWPWETLVVLPGAWLLLLRAARAAPGQGAGRPDRTLGACAPQ